MSFRETKENEGIGPYQPERSILLIRLEDCFIFKDWVEKLFKEGNITLSKSVLVDSPPTLTGGGQGQIQIAVPLLIFSVIFDLTRQERHHAL